MVTANHTISPLRPSDPQRLGTHRIVGRLGRGGMGTVYLAESESGERAAIKMINPELADDETFRERFRREVESARRVRRFCTAPVLDARTGQFIGTPAYMAPELISGVTASPASDVFAWACVVAFAGTGRAPFNGPTVPSILYQISHGEPSLDGLDEGLRHLVERALAKDPAQRPTAQELLDALTGRQHADTAETAATVGRTWALSSGRLTRPDSMPHGSSPTRALPPKPPKPAQRPLVLGAATLAVLIVLGVGAFLLFRGPVGPPSNVASVFNDDFSNTGSGWSGSTWISGSGYFQGGYRIDAGGSSARQWEKAPFDGNLPVNLLIGVDATVKAGPPYGQIGVYCRGTGDSSDSPSYDFLVRADGHGALIRREAGDRGSKEIARKSSAAGFKVGKTNRLQIACEQDGKKVHLRFWINGHLAVEASDVDGPLPNGGTGLMAELDNGGSGGDIQTFFDNYELSAIG